MMLMKHKAFESKAHHRWFKYALPEDGGGVVDWLQKYEDFAKTDEAPQFIKDDFRQMNFVDDGEEIAVDDETTQDSDFQVFAVNPHFEAVASAIAGSLDAAAWAMRSARRYTEAKIKDAGTWTKNASVGAGPPVPPHVDIRQLNEAQAFVYKTVTEHDARQRSNPLQSKPLHALVNGTAGSGKSAHDINATR